MTDFLTSAARNGAPDTGAASARSPGRKLADWFAALREDDAMAFRHVLMLRFAVINLVAVALLGAAWLKGWVGLVVAGDRTQLVAVIAVVFLAGLFESGRKLFLTSSELNQVSEPTRAGTWVADYLAAVRGKDGHGRSIAGSSLKLKLSSRIAPIRHIANSLVFLGLIGTVIGFIIALSGVDPNSVADVNAIGPMVSTLIGGMSVALYTTLVGAILNIWLMLNYRLLESGTVKLLTAIVELGERDA